MHAVVTFDVDQKGDATVGIGSHHQCHCSCFLCSPTSPQKYLHPPRCPVVGAVRAGGSAQTWTLTMRAPVYTGMVVPVHIVRMRARVYTGRVVNTESISCAMFHFTLEYLFAFTILTTLQLLQNRRCKWTQWYTATININNFNFISSERASIFPVSPAVNRTRSTSIVTVRIQICCMG